ncbi:uncharacterized protein LOC106459628 [Limulus polyphemus]|uniref:Uncharacterized protein LOC106459628 n=1 Tax=Limulus polyphemus TaxID=6850 RepID=A0ABM1B4K9_LIMPO|nr:uncharacterized protein LOC106459628 [Limulus polyphemus]
MDSLFIFVGFLLYIPALIDGAGRQQSFGQNQLPFGQQSNYQQPGSFGSQDSFGSPQPFDFNYNVKDEFGNSHYHQEQGDQSGNVLGSYGYTNANGLFRYVEYSADSSGFTAKVHSNEPGVYPDNPADVTLNVEQPPAGLQDQYTRRTSGGGYQKPQQLPDSTYSGQDYVQRPVGYQKSGVKRAG